MEMSRMLPRVMGLHMQLGKATLSGCASVGDGHLIGVASSSLFKRTDSQKRSYINYYFRLLEKTKKEWEGDRVERMCQKHRAAPPALCLTLILSSFSVQIQRQKCLFLSVPVCFCHVTMQKPPHQQSENSPRVLCCFCLTEDSTFLWLCGPGGLQMTHLKRLCHAALARCTSDAA